MTVNRDTLVRLARAGILTGLSDGVFASVLSVLVFHSTVTRVWQDHRHHFLKKPS